MAYVNLVNQTISDVPEYYQILRDFVCKRDGGTYDYSTTGIGWTLVDEYHALSGDFLGDPGFNNADLGKTAEDYFIIHSTGEDGTADMYYRIRWNTPTYFYVRAYAYWDASTHTGSTLLTADSATIVTLQPDMLMIYGDLDTFLFHTRSTNAANSQYVTWIGKHNTYGDNTVCTTTTPLVAGTDVEIITDQHGANDWEIGDKLLIRDTNQLTCSYEKIIITNVNHSTPAITATLTKSYSSGARIQHRPDYGYGTNSGVGAALDLNVLLRVGTGTPGRDYSGIDTGVPGGGDPDVHTDKVYSVPFQWGTTTGEPTVIGYTSLNFRFISYNALTALFGDVYANGVIQDENGDTWRLLYMWSGGIAVREV